MTSPAATFLGAIEPRLRVLLPADLYVTVWLDQSPATLLRVFRHLRALRRILDDYMPRQIWEAPPRPGSLRQSWRSGTLMFTDLVGFTPLMEAHAAQGQAGAETVLQVLNSYFAEMIEIISKSGGNLLEFTGDAMLILFPTQTRGRDRAQAVRAGLRMQRAMAARAARGGASAALGMRVGIHHGRFLSADIGTPHRMEHVLLGPTVQRTKAAEGAGLAGRICVSAEFAAELGAEFRTAPADAEHCLVIDDLADDELGEYDIVPNRRRGLGGVLFDSDPAELLAEIEIGVNQAAVLASYFPPVILQVMVENTAQRRIAPEFPAPAVMFVQLLGLTEGLTRATPDEEASILASFSELFARINAVVEARGGVLKKVTYDRAGSVILIYFGSPNMHSDDARRAALAAVAIRTVAAAFVPPTIGGLPVTIGTKIGLTQGPVFVAEIGEPRGRREFNILGDTVNIAARLSQRAAVGEILATAAVAAAAAPAVSLTPLGPVSLKGKAAALDLYALNAAM